MLVRDNDGHMMLVYPKELREMLPHEDRVITDDDQDAQHQGVFGRASIDFRESFGYEPISVIPDDDRYARYVGVFSGEVNNLEDESFRYEPSSAHDPYRVTLTKEKVATHVNKLPYVLKSSPVDVYFHILRNQRIQGEEYITIACSIRDAKGKPIDYVYIEDVNKQNFFYEKEYREDKVRELQMKAFSKILNAKKTCKMDDKNYGNRKNNNIDHGTNVGLGKASGIKSNYI